MTAPCDICGEPTDERYVAFIVDGLKFGHQACIHKASADWHAAEEAARAAAITPAAP